MEKNLTYKTELGWYQRADEVLCQNMAEEIVVPSVPAMSFVDPDLMSPFPLVGQNCHEYDKEIKEEEPDFPTVCSSPDNLNEASSCSNKLFFKSTLHETISQQIDEKPVVKQEDIKHPELPTTELSSDEQPTKIIWNGLEDDLLEGKWSLKNSVKFLRLYGAHRCLWDLKDPDYRVKDLRDAALTDIAAAMGHGLDAEYVGKKIKIFRITYMQHRKRMLKAMKAGKEPEIQLRWFPLADSFLRPHIGLRSIKSGEKEMPQFDFHYVYANLNLIDPALLNDFEGKGTQNSIEIGSLEPQKVHENTSSDDEADNFDYGLLTEKMRNIEEE